MPLLSTESVGIHGWPLVNAASLGSSVLGAVIVRAEPRHPVGWLLSLVGFTTCLSLAAESYSVWVLQEGGPGSLHQGQVAAWFAGALGGPLALSCISVVFLVVPTGLYLSSRWRWVTRAAVAGYTAYLLGLLLVGPHAFNRDGEPTHVGVVNGILLTVGFLLIMGAVLASVACMLVRLRR